MLDSLSGIYDSGRKYFLMKTYFALMENSILRSAIQQNLVSFPSQVPAFVRHGEDHQRIVQLYFVRGWPISEICARYKLGRSVVRGLLSEWRIRAVGAGYIQAIHPEALELLAVESDVDRAFHPAPPGEPEPASALAPPDLVWEPAARALLSA
jgi:hypothetical protein